MSPRMLRSALVTGMLLLCAAAPVTSPSDAIQIRPQSGGRATTTQPLAMPSLSVDISRLFMAMVIVIALIFVARWFLKRMYGGGALPGGSRAVQVLHRTPLAPRQQVMLLQVGRRVVVVGESNGAMTTLAQIDDPDEIAQLVGRLSEERAGKVGAFSGIFGKAQNQIAAPEQDEAVSSGASERTIADAAEGRDVRSDLSTLLDKVRSIRQQIDKP